MPRRLLLSGHDLSSAALLGELPYLMLKCSPGAGNRVYDVYNRVSPKRKYVYRLIHAHYYFPRVTRLTDKGKGSDKTHPNYFCRGTTHTALACYLSRLLSTLVSV